MAGPTVELFSTSILSNVKVRTRHERFTSVFAIKKIHYVYHDLASDDDAKSRWRRKAKDPQLPGILVNNEWVGTYDEFEEAVEFGELELFLGVSPAAAQATPPAPHPAQSAVSSKDPSLYPTLPYASEGAGRWKEPDADEFISALNIKEDELTDADVDAMLADLGKMSSALPATSEKKYVPSKEATIKPLRLAKMGPTTSHQRMPSGSPSPSSAGAGTRASPIARYSATQRSTRALAAEASALTSNRKTSGALLREAVSQGKNLDDAMEESRMKHIVSQDNIDDLFASLGLSNVDIGDDEVDQFLEQGAIPQGLRQGGERVHRPSSSADKARDEAVARGLAQKAKEKGHGSGSARASLSSQGAKSIELQPAPLVGSSVEQTSDDKPTTSKSHDSALTRATSQPAESPKVVEESKEQATPDATLAEPAAEKTQDTSVEPIGTASEESAAEQAKTEVTPAIQESDAPHATQDSITASESKASVDESHVPEKAIAEENVADKPNAAGSIAPEDDAEAMHEASASTSSAEKSLSTKAEDESEPSVKRIDDEVASVSSAPKVDTVTTTSSAEVAAEEPQSLPELVEPNTIEEEKFAVDGKDASKVDEEVDNRSKDADLARVDEDRTPTKEVVKDPIQAQPSPKRAPSIAATQPAEDEAKFEHELAQAAMIASRFEDHKTANPKSQELEGDNQNAATEPDVTTEKDATTQPVQIPVRDDSKSEEAPVQAVSDKATQPSQPISTRQASSSSLMTSSRRAIDVSRPIDAATARSVSASVTVPPSSSHSDLSVSPDTLAKKKKMGIRGFGLGKDKDKNKETGSDKKKAKADPPRRHERTISEILREADAVLQSDDYDDGGSGVENGEDSDGESEDPNMFGASSVDVETAPTVTLRSTSRQI